MFDKLKKLLRQKAAHASVTKQQPKRSPAKAGRKAASGKAQKSASAAPHRQPTAALSQSSHHHIPVHGNDQEEHQEYHKPRPTGEVILDIKDIWASVEGKQILKGISLQLHKGNIHVIMGPNGGGKSTLSNILMGHPKYAVDTGTAILD